jgi:hypothetical protein
MLIGEASEKLGFLVAEHGFRQEEEVARWGTTVTFHGEIWTLYLFYGNREFDFTAEIKYHRFPRKNPKLLWAVLEAMGIDGPLNGPQTMVDDACLSFLVAATAESIAQHWDALNRVPTQELFRNVERILDRCTRRVQSGG